MAKSEYVYLKGKTKWFRNIAPNQWQKWSHVLYPDAASVEVIRQLQADGAKNILKKDEDGYYLSLNRPTSKVFKGIPQGLTPPEVMLPDGTPLPASILVGNGSDITTKMVVYSHNTPGGGKAKAMRWESTRIDNLVPFDNEKDFTPQQELQRKNLQEQPTPIF